jgi:hypothetical protein
MKKQSILKLLLLVVGMALAMWYCTSKPSAPEWAFGQARTAGVVTTLANESALCAFIQAGLMDGETAHSARILYSEQAKTYYVEAALMSNGRDIGVVAKILKEDADGYLGEDPEAPCTHRCVTSLGCSGCSLTIIENCKSIECKCGNGSGCSSEITTGS